MNSFWERIKRKIFYHMYGEKLYNSRYNKEQFRIRKLLRFEVNLTDHCNLNCIGCSHFSPIAPENYIVVDNFKKDIERLAKLFNGKCETIDLMGGEPLLHPNLSIICQIARENFRETKIRIVTNGILILKYDDTFWSNLSINNIGLIITKYPINLDYNLINEKAEKMNIKLWIKGQNVERKQVKRPFDLKGRKSKIKNFFQCEYANVCINLKDGKLFPCVTAAHANIFNSFFNKDMIISNKDYVDIYKAKDKEEILHFLSKPIPFCRYCNKDAIVRDIDWGISKKVISEWV